MKMKPLLYTLLACGLIAATAMAQEQPDLTIKCSDVKVKVAGALETDAYAINNKNAIAGDYIDSSSVQHGMIMKGKIVTSFDGPAGSTSIAAYGINTAGVVVGWYLDSSGTPQSFSYAKGTFSSVAFPGAAYTEANGINDPGWIVGTYVDSSGNTHGFYWDTKTYHSIDIPGASYTVAWAINNNKLMTAYDVSTSSCLPIDGYTYDGTTFTKIDPPGSAGTAIHGINNKGDIDFTIFDSSNNRHGVLYQKSTGVFTQYDDSKGVNTTRADGINDKDTMVGRYSPASGNPANAGFKCTVK